MIRTYSELTKLPTFEERYDYLRLDGEVGKSTFGFDRILNQILYRSTTWLRVRDAVILRDNGCDLGDPGHEIRGRILVHHMNPITVEEILNESNNVFSYEYLVCVSHNTHLAIHYGDKSLLPKELVPRRQNDTCPWKF